MRQACMADTVSKPGRRGAVKLAELVGRVLDPVTARRGFASHDLVAAWAEIVGPRYADCSRPEKIVWPKGEAGNGPPAYLVLRVDGPKAIFVQHEAGQIVERVNAFLGYAAIGHLRIVQAPVGAALPRQPPRPLPLAPEQETHLAETIAEVANEDLRAALDRLGRRVLADNSR